MATAIEEEPTLRIFSASTEQLGLEMTSYRVRGGIHDRFNEEICEKKL